MLVLAIEPCKGGEHAGIYGYLILGVIIFRRFYLMVPRLHTAANIKNIRFPD
jgi:hypothetical protein